jgi:Fic family protein
VIYETPDVGPGEHAALARIEELRRELRYYTAEPRRWVGPVRRVLSAKAVQGSNSIEGINVNVEDALAAIEGDEPMDADEADWHAVRGYQQALTYVIQLADDDAFGYTADLLRSLHFMMTSYDLAIRPGRWRPGSVYVRNDATGDLVYEGPDAELVPELMDELVKQLGGVGAGVPVHVRAAMAHLNLVMIHPFKDGNGRMARCLQTLVLTREKILVPEFCSIEEHLGRNTDAYYRILGDVGQGQWRPRNDARPWVRFCLAAHYVQATSVLRRVRESERMWGEIDTLRAVNRLQERTMAALFDAALGLRVRNASYRSALLHQWAEEISLPLATSDLRALVNAGMLEQVGRKKGTYYVAAGPVFEVSRRIRQGRQRIDTSHLFEPEKGDE